ncbi:MAG: hypothetical protein Q8Q62_07045 [Mesorhizobium sp.]|nr:hypothetical protein [Mesorhizobium sp.]
MTETTGNEKTDVGDDVMARVHALLKEKEAVSEKKGFWYFVSSGFFFMLVGAVSLTFAFYSMGNTHASFTFVLVVVGVAVLLYGTGTQGVGNFETTSGAATYKLGIAGGAGILAFAVAYGIVAKAPEIKRAFQIEKRYLRLSFEPSAKDGVSTFENYVPEVIIEGTAAPVHRNGDAFVVFVSYFDNQPLTKLRVIAKLHYVGPEDRRNKALRANVLSDQIVEINRKDLKNDDGGFDFPRYLQPVEVSMASDPRSEAAGREADEQNGRLSGADELPPSALVPAL